MKFSTTTAALVIIAIIIVVLVVVFAARRGIYQPTTSPAPIVEIAATASALTVSNQTATNSATIDNVVLAQGGYVVVHAATPEGAPGAVIGYTDYLEPGEYDEITVQLTKPVKVGDTIFPMLHGDDGDATYGFPDEDLPLKDDAGQIIVKKVKVVAP